MKVLKLAALAAFGLTAACVDEQPSVQTTAVYFGNDSSRWAFDGECDDPRFRGRGMAVTLLAEDAFRDATDCRILFQTGNIVYVG